MYHSAPSTRFNNISPSSRSNYQVASMRDFTRQQTLQTSFIENGNGSSRQRLSHQQRTPEVGGNGTGNGCGMNINGNGTIDSLRQNSNAYLKDRPATVDLLAQPMVVSAPVDAAENVLTFSTNETIGSNSSNNTFGPP